jgi:hypothetical protein
MNMQRRINERPHIFEVYHVESATLRLAALLKNFRRELFESVKATGAKYNASAATRKHPRS